MPIDFDDGPAQPYTDLKHIVKRLLDHETTKQKTIEDLVALVERYQNYIRTGAHK